MSPYQGVCDDVEGVGDVHAEAEVGPLGPDACAGFVHADVRAAVVAAAAASRTFQLEGHGGALGRGENAFHGHGLCHKHTHGRWR